MKIKPIIVAEIGINHNGSLPMAKNLIAIASNYGADYVKFQKRNPEICVPDTEKDIRKKTVFGPMKYIEYKRKIEFGKKEYDEIDKYCSKLNIGWFASVWDIDSVDFIKQYDVPFLKIASACVTDMELIKYICDNTKAPVIMSTGMCNREQIDKALFLFGNRLKYILHTTSSYPTPASEMNMKKLKALQEFYPKYKIGFSNHCIDIIYTVQAYAMGAKMLEFHITLDRNLPGTDQFASIGPIGFERIMSHINSINKGWGNGKIEIQPSEEAVCKKLRRIQ